MEIMKFSKQAKSISFNLTDCNLRKLKAAHQLGRGLKKSTFIVKKRCNFYKI